MSEVTNFVVEWKTRVRANSNYYFGVLTFADAAFALEYYPEHREFFVCFRPPCCLTDRWETSILPQDRDVAYALCIPCELAYKLYDERSTLVYSPNEEDTDSEQYQKRAMELYLTHWGKNPIDATIVSLDFVDFMRDFMENFKALPVMPSISVEEYNATWGVSL